MTNVFVLVLAFLFGLFPSSRAHAQEPIKLRASVVAKTFGFGPLWVASRQGFFSQQKLDVEVLLIRGSDVSTQALAGGSLQVSGASSDAPIAAFARGLDMVIVGGIINGLSQSIMAGKNYKTYDASSLGGLGLGADRRRASVAASELRRRRTRV
jgi:ABC-type nitrate/sulfonate/bicarbonate transport system substrate-binding protein